MNHVPSDLAITLESRLDSLRSATNGEMRAVRREFSKQIHGFDGGDVIQLALRVLDRARYELLARYLRTDAGRGEVFGKFDPIRGKKVDKNNHGGFSTEFIGAN